VSTTTLMSFDTDAGVRYEEVVAPERGPADMLIFRVDRYGSLAGVSIGDEFQNVVIETVTVMSKPPHATSSLHAPPVRYSRLRVVGIIDPGPPHRPRIRLLDVDAAPQQPGTEGA
jgi:hypothetical protein